MLYTIRLCTFASSAFVQRVCLLKGMGGGVVKELRD